MSLLVREYEDTDLSDMIVLWNRIVEDGMSFPQKEFLTQETGRELFARQSYTGVVEEDNKILGLYTLHPNNVGRCAHISNAAYCVFPYCRGKGIGRMLVNHSLEKSNQLGFHGLQFNAVVSSNASAIHLYENLGFTKIGTIPGGFQVKSGKYEDILLFYHATV